MDSSPSEKTIGAVETACDIVEMLREGQRTTASELAEELEYSSSTIHYYLKTLRSRGYIVRRNGEYRISRKFLSTSREMLNDEFVVAAAEPLEDLARETGVLAFGGVTEGASVFVTVVSSSNRNRSRIGLGDELPIHASALGKVILSASSDEDIEDLLKRNLTSFTTRTKTEMSPLLKDIETARDLGIGYADQEYKMDSREIATNIREPSGRIKGAIGVAGSVDEIKNPVKRSKPRRFAEEIPDKLKRQARTIEDELATLVKEEE